MSADRKRAAPKAVRSKEASAGKRSAEAPPKKATAASPDAKHSVKKSTGSYVLSPPNGPRTVSHKRIKEAVEKVFRERLVANG